MCWRMGVPRSSVSSFLLFSNFINVLPIGILSAVSLFAKDCIVYRRVTWVRDSLCLPQEIESTIAHSITVNKMSLIDTKSSLISFGRKIIQFDNKINEVNPTSSQNV